VRATYVDSSALVKLVVYEAETEALRKFLASSDQMTSSLVTRVELSRAVARRLPEAGAVAQALLESVVIVGLDARIATRAAGLAPASVRSLDAIHLATALELGADLTAFVCYDDRLSAAATALGLQVVSPR
jgi:predicted nucleic acid-binding protein